MARGQRIQTCNEENRIDTSYEAYTARDRHYDMRHHSDDAESSQLSWHSTAFLGSNITRCNQSR